MKAQEPEANVPQLAADINRFAALIGSMSPGRTAGYDVIADVKLDLFGDCTVKNLATAMALPESQEIVIVQCHAGERQHPDGTLKRPICTTMIETTRFNSPFVACEACIDRYHREQKQAMYGDYWKSICPESFRKTDTTHVDFPRAIYAELKKVDPKQSLFLFGPTGSSKTRVGMLMLKRALLRGRRVGVLWPEKLHLLGKGYDNSLFDKYAEYDDLLMDDSLLTACRESKLLDSIKMIIDVRMREERPTIFTSQIGSEDEIASGKEFGEAKSADLERIKAVIRRLRESCVVVSFAKVKPADGQTSF